MKKILSLLFACLLMVGTAHAAVDIASGDNVVILGSHMGPVGATPVTEVVKCHLGTNASQVVGNAVMWDTTSTSPTVLGYSVIPANVDGGGLFAGVMVTTTSQESTAQSTLRGSGPQVGYMAVRGLVRAKIDTSASTVGKRLRLNGSTLAGSLATDANGTPSLGECSGDIGVLLEHHGTDAILRVWLN